MRVTIGQIEERLGQGVDTLQQLLDAGQADSYDFAFIGQQAAGCQGVLPANFVISSGCLSDQCLYQGCL